MSAIGRVAWKCIREYVKRAPLARGKGYVMDVGTRLFGPIVIEERGNKYELYPEQFIDSQIFRGDRFEPEVSDAIQRHLAGGGTFIDIGAHWGYFTTIAASMPNVRVMAFEPSPQELSRLHRQLILNGLHNVVVYPMALGDSSSVVRLNLAPKWNPGRHSLLDIGGQGGNGVSVPCERFDDVVSPGLLDKVRLCKIDVEGYEGRVVRGMEASIPRMRNCTFIIEVTPEFLKRAGDSVDSLYDFMARFGYRGRMGRSPSLEQYNEVFVREEQSIRIDPAPRLLA